MSIPPPFQLHLSRYQPGSALERHQHSEAWLCLVLQGSYDERIRGRQEVHGRGDILFCPASEQHAQHIGRDGALKLLLAPDQAVLGMMADQGARLAHAPFVRGSDTLRQLGSRLQRELAVDDGFSALAVHGLAFELIAHFGRDLTRERVGPAPAWLRGVKERVEQELDQGWSLAELGAEAGKHPAHLARAFQQHYGCTIGAHIRRARAERAARLLRSSAMPMIDIALDCGYSDAAHFSRSFKAVFSLTPTAYRERMR